MFKPLVAGLAASLILAAAADAQRSQRFRVSENDIASAPEALNALDFVRNQALGVEGRLISARPGDIPGMLLVRLPGDDYWNPYSILSDAERAERVSVEVLDREQGNYVDLNFREGTEFGTDGSPLSFLAGMLGLQSSRAFRTRFRFEPLMTARGPSYGPGEPDLSDKVDAFAASFSERGFEAYYVNSVDIYRSLTERYTASDNTLSAGFAFVTGGSVYSLEDAQTRQRLHYVVNAVRVLPRGTTAEAMGPRAGGVETELSDADARARFVDAVGELDASLAAGRSLIAEQGLAAALAQPTD